VFDQSNQLEGHYLKTPGGTPESKALKEVSWEKYLEADSVERDAEALGRNAEGEIPVVGLALTVANIAWTSTRANRPARRSSAGSAARWQPSRWAP
jgi:hypothetical protein